MDPNFQCMSIWPEKTKLGLIKIDGKPWFYYTEKQLHILWVNFLRCCISNFSSLWDPNRILISKLFKGLLNEFLPACILHSHIILPFQSGQIFQLSQLSSQLPGKARKALKTNLSGNYVIPQDLGFQKLAKLDHFGHL